MSQQILIVDDERAIREEIADFLGSKGLACAVADCGEQAIKLVKERDFDVILCDVILPDIHGTELIDEFRQHSPESLIVLITAHPSVETVVTALRKGVSDYLTKPLILEEILCKVRFLIEYRAQQIELRWHRQRLQADMGADPIIGDSPRLQEVRALISRVADNLATVLITGESGTGKELIAHAIHRDGPRREGRFIAINCAAIPRDLLESQLFGHVKGAFTGADRSLDGVFTIASGGTLFLDEIGDLSLEHQPKLLRAIENQEIWPVGAPEPVTVDARIVASTNKDLEDEVGRGAFREDLYYRLSVITIPMPPLRDRLEDVPALAEHFIQQSSNKLRRPVRGLTNDALQRLLRYKWKGNVRELQNVIERAVILEDGDLITPAALPSNPFHHSYAAESVAHLKGAVREFETDYVRTILRATDGDKHKAAELLGVSVSSLYRRLRETDVESAGPGGAAAE